jgi:wyosine [tRNA(Phe)-imidazoG37] synthetase (radical SAM superfamily)
LGINLLPGDGKVCTFDCIYCECGLNAQRKPRTKLPTRQQVAEALRLKLEQMKAEGLAPDVLTFAGNG